MLLDSINRKWTIAALTHQLKQGNQLAFTILYDTYSEQVYRLAFKYLCNKELAEDAVQNLFMKVWIKRTSLDESRPLNHFLIAVAFCCGSVEWIIYQKC